MAKESNILNIITSFKDKYTKRIAELEEENTKLKNNNDYDNLLVRHNDLKQAYSESEAEIIKLNEQITKINKEYNDTIDEITKLFTDMSCDDNTHVLNTPVLTSTSINNHYISPIQLEKRLDQLYKKPQRRFKKSYCRHILKRNFNKNESDVDLYNDNFKKLMDNYNINNVMKTVSENEDDKQIDNSYSYFSAPTENKILPFQEPFSLFSFPNPFLDLSFRKKD